MIDQLIEERHNISYITAENGKITEASAFLLFNNVLKCHCLSLSLTSDQDSLFISRILKNFCKIFGIQVSLSTAFQPKTYRQNAIVNQEIKKHL